jgi:RHS repeat-associated protein
MRSTRLAPRLRVGILTAIFTVTALGLDAAPVVPPPSDESGEEASAPLPFGLGPDAARAAYCASNPSFTGRLTASSGSTTAVSRTTSANVYGYISNVSSGWSCTLYRRYSAVAWNTTASLGRFNWGTIINSTGVACNWLVGTTDYLKANDTADCPDSDAEYAMQVTLTAQRVYHADVDHDGEGDFSYAHADCDTTPYYGDELGKGTESTPVSFSTGSTSNRPGANCDPITLDGTGTTQTVTYDSTAPALAFTTPSAATYRNTTATYNVVHTVTEAVAGFGGANLWRLQRQIASISAPNTCGTFANDTAAGNLTTGTTTGSITTPQTLADLKCYRWVANATDQNGNVATQKISSTVMVDTPDPTTDFTTPNEGTTTVLNGTSYSVAWTEVEQHSGILSRSLQRRVATYSGGACGTYANDGSAVTTASPVSVTGLLDGKCYQWIQTLTDRAANSTATTSGTVRVDVGSPSANFGTPDEGTTSFINTTSYSVAWTETAGSGSITARSLQRWKSNAAVATGTCEGVTWVTDGPVDTGVSPRPQSLSHGYCYRWVQTLTNSVPKTAASTSGSVLVDTAAPTATLTYPEANRPLAGTVAISGSVGDATSWKEYQVEVGAGTSPSSWTSLGIFPSVPLPGEPLAEWATGSLVGPYSIRLTARDKATNSTVVNRLVYLDNGRRTDEPYHTRVPFDLGGGYILQVGVADGEATLERDLFSIPSYGPAQALDLHYSSLEPATAGRFGTGWVSNLTQYLTFDSGFVVWHPADGGTVPFGNVAGVWTPLAGRFETLTRGASEDTITLKDQMRYVFENSGAGRLKRIENRFGLTLTLVWNTSSATATDASGRATSIVIDAANNRITAVTDSAGRVWRFAYSAAGDLCRMAEGSTVDLTSLDDPCTTAVASTGPDNNVLTRFAYDASHRLTSVTRSRSRVSGAPETITWSIGYTAGKATSVTDPVNASVANTFTYNTADTVVGLLKEYSPLERPEATYAFDELGRVESATGPTGLVTGWTYDAASNVLTVGRPAGDGETATTTFTYDTRGNALTETSPIDATTTVVTAYSYNSTNDVLTESQADNDASVKLVTKYTYDGTGHLTSANLNCTSSGTTPPADASTCAGGGTQDSKTNLITAYTYTANHQVENETDPLGRVTRHVYDAHGRETSIIANYVAGQSATHERNATTTYAYATNQAGNAGLVTSETDPGSSTTAFTYDALGRQLTEVSSGDTSIPALTRTTTYDELGNVLTRAESWTPLGGGSTVTRTTSHVYDLANRETSVTDPAGLVATTGYDAAGNAVSSSTGGVQTARVFNALGQLATETIEGADPGAGVTSHAYDDAGNEIGTSDPAGVQTDRVVTYTGLVTSEVVNDGGAALTTLHSYDKLGREIGSESPEGTVTTTSYDRPGRLSSTTVAGATTSFTYDRVGNQTSVTDPASVVTTTTYDPLNRPTVVVANDVASPTLPTEDITTTTYYDAAGVTVAVKDALGKVARTIPNVRGLGKTNIANCTNSGTTPPADPAACSGAGMADATTNVRSTFEYDGAGTAVLTVTAVGTGAEATTETASDAGGRVQAVKDPRDTISRTFYDVDGNVSKTVVNCTNSGTTVPTTGWASCAGTGTQDGTYNLTTTYGYDDHGNRTSETAPNGRVTTLVNDEADRLVRRIDNDVASPSGPTEDVTTEYFYDEVGRPAAVKAPTADGATFSVTRTFYDDEGRVTREVLNCTDTGTTPPADPASCTGAGTADADTNLTTTYTYDDRGNRLSVTAPDPSATSGTGAGTVVTRNAYDAQGRLCRVLERATVDLQTLADPCTTAATPATATQNLSTRYTYDGAGNLASMIDANTNTTAYGYDERGQMVSMTNGLGDVIGYGYDALGRKTSETWYGTPPQATKISWTYDGAGRVLTRTADGATTTSTYDENGNQLTAQNGVGTITTTYDRLNRPLTVSVSGDAGASTSYTYSLTSPSWTDPTGSYSASLDKFDRQTSLTDPIHGASTFTWSYRADGQLASAGAPNGNSTAFGYDDAGAPTSKTTTGTGGAARAAYTWTRNQAGQILSEASTISGDPANGTATFAYDLLGRLTGYTRAGTTTTYGWDEVPNRTSVQVGANPAVTTSFDVANRPTTDSAGGSYTHDDDGRMTARPGYRLEWDALGRLTKVRPPSGSGTIVDYTYDALDRLLKADYGGSNRIRFRYVGRTTAVAQTVQDTNSQVIRSTANGWGGERLVDWTGTNANQRFYGTNGHHDVTWTADATGVVTNRLRYDPWGTAVSTSGTSLPEFRFQGSWYDTTTELSWVITRWYAPAQGRFVSQDSLLGEPADPPSRHLYAYAEGEPLGRWDPDGRWSTLPWSGKARHRSAAFGFPNRKHLKGRIEVGLFIAAKYNIAPIPLAGTWRLWGDDRPGPAWSAGSVKCAEARGCVKVNFSTSTIVARVNPTCGQKNTRPQGGYVWGALQCRDAFSIGSSRCADDRCNIVTRSESLKGVLTVRWDITQSLLPIFRPQMTVNGRMIVYPPTSSHGAYVDMWGEGFPSEEWFYYNERGLRTRLTRRPEGPFIDMAPTLGDWYMRRYLPRESYDGPIYA